MSGSKCKHLMHLPSGKCLGCGEQHQPLPDYEPGDDEHYLAEDAGSPIAEPPCPLGEFHGCASTFKRAEDGAECCDFCGHPVAAPQDSDAAWLRSYANSSANGWENRERLCRIAARLEAPIAEDALVEALEPFEDRLTQLEGACRKLKCGMPGETNVAVSWLRLARAALHEKKG